MEQQAETDLIKRCRGGDRRAFADLVDRYKVLVFNLEEIGEVMALPMGTVKTHLHRAKQALRHMIMEEGLWKEMSAAYSARQVTQ